MSARAAATTELGDARERALRCDLAAAFRLAAMNGWDDLIATHMSVRIPGPDRHFLINPFGVLFDEMTASKLVKIDLEGKPVEPTPYKVNAAGFTIHSAIHQAREDAHCVIHLHTIPGIAVSCQAQGLLPLHQHVMLLNGRIAYHDYEGIAFNLEERPRLVADLGNKNVMMLRNHGTLSVGRSVAEAFYFIYFLERACAAQVAAQSSGAALITPGPAVQKIVQGQVGDDEFLKAADELVWPGLLRRLDRVDTGWRD